MEELEHVYRLRAKEPLQRKKLKKLGRRPWSEGKIAFEQEGGLEKSK